MATKAVSTEELVCTDEIGPYAPPTPSQTIIPVPILYGATRSGRTGQVHVMSGPDRESQLRQTRTPTPAPRFLFAISPEQLARPGAREIPHHSEVDVDDTHPQPAAVPSAEQICTNEQGPHEPGTIQATRIFPPILTRPEQVPKSHPDHIQIKSRSDHTSRLRQERPPTPAPRFLLPISTEELAKENISELAMRGLPAGATTTCDWARCAQAAHPEPASAEEQPIMQPSGQQRDSRPETGAVEKEYPQWQQPQAENPFLMQPQPQLGLEQQFPGAPPMIPPVNYPGFMQFGYPYMEPAFMGEQFSPPPICSVYTLACPTCGHVRRFCIPDAGVMPDFQPDPIYTRPQHPCYNNGTCPIVRSYDMPLEYDRPHRIVFRRRRRPRSSSPYRRRRRARSASPPNGAYRTCCCDYLL